MVLLKEAAKEKGFTLLEIVFVAALLGLVLLIAVPATAGLAGGQNLEVTTRGLAMDLRKAQQKAIATGRVQRVEFREFSNDYVIRDVLIGERRTVKFPAGVTYRSVNFNPLQGHRSIEFYPGGNPNMGGTITLIDDSGRARSVVVTVATGRVRLGDDLP